MAEDKVLNRAMKAVLQLFFAPQCLSCGVTIFDEGGLCPDCWRDCDFISGLACDQCGAPLPDDGTGFGIEPSGTSATGPPRPAEGANNLEAASPHDTGSRCDDCREHMRPWQGGRAAVVYSGTGRGLVLALKHGDRPDLAPALGAWIARAAADLIRPGMIVVPVPTHPRRLMRRRYNQAALLAAQLASHHGLRHEPGLLIRRRHTPMLENADFVQRYANLDQAIAVNPRHKTRLTGQHVLLVDDVMTSGATLSSCTQVLQQAGAGQVSIATLARAVKAT